MSEAVDPKAAEKFVPQAKYTVTEAAKLLGQSRTIINDAALSGELPRRQGLISIKSLRRFASVQKKGRVARRVVRMSLCLWPTCRKEYDADVHQICPLCFPPKTRRKEG